MTYVVEYTRKNQDIPSFTLEWKLTVEVGVQVPAYLAKVSE